MFPWCVQVVAWVRISFLLLPYSILLYGYATFHLSIQIWIASFCGKSLFALMFLFLLSGNLGLELLGHTADLGLTFRKLLTCFPKGRHHFALSNLIWQMRTSKLWEAMSPAKDLIGFWCQTWDSNPHLMSLKPVLLTARWTRHLLLWMREPLTCDSDLSLGAWRPCWSSQPLRPLALGGGVWGSPG